MLDIGWQEFVLVGFVLLIVVGPQDLPKVLKTIVNTVRKIKSMAYDFQNSVDEMADQAEISKLKNEVTKLKSSNSISETKSEIENINRINEDTKSFVKKNISKIKHKKT
tara:strand:- start:2311 stop:2637 length:327 start_codon:yes stop_codon:yes gene_type:complete